LFFLGILVFGMEIQEKSIEHLISIIRNGNPKPVLLLGAGASVKSGIPATGGFVERAAMWTYAKENGTDISDIRIRRSDWLPFLQNQSWFIQNKKIEDNYTAVFKHLLTPQEVRKEFFNYILHPKVPPSDGYKALNDLVVGKHFDTILTTNFDNIPYKVCAADERNHRVSVIKNEAEYNKISSAPTHLQIIQLHGDFENYTDKNDVDETQSLNDNLVRSVMPLLKDHPLIVIGYRGAENSIMKRLFLENLSYTTNFHHGIYWCILENDQPLDFHENLKALHTAIGSNLQIVRIKGFDELFCNDLFKGLKNSYSTRPTVSQTTSIDVFDLMPVKEASFETLDRLLLRQRMVQYCRSLHIQIPEIISDIELTDILIERDLMAIEGGKKVCTNAGVLLFGNDPSVFVPSASVKIIVNDSEDFFKKTLASFSSDLVFDVSNDLNHDINIKGHLWDQLDKIIDVLSIYNKEFKLKGAVTQTVTPYSALALKELIVNAIVHRDYTVNEPVKIIISPKSIKIQNPGGLIQEVQERLDGEAIEEVIKRGSRGTIKGYRNPVLADLFYGTNTMEKRGSGLSDVFDETKRYSTSVTFGPTEDNTHFEATIYARPEIVDALTQTAKVSEPEYVTRFSSNFIEFAGVPAKIFMADATASLVTIFEEISLDPSPPFLHKENKIISFFPIDNPSFGLSRFIDLGTLVEIPREEYLENADREREFIYLLNRSVLTHLRYLGLQTDREKRRAFFQRNIKDEENVQIRYQARVKSATRTVVKKRVSPATNQVIYWEHKSFSFKVEKAGEGYGIFITPNYTFTLDGNTEYLKPEKINSLSTKRSSRDYNMHYLNDLNFWSWIIRGGMEEQNSIRILPEQLQEKLPVDSLLVLADNYEMCSVTDEQLFTEFIDETETQEDIEEVYEGIDLIAVEKEDDGDDNSDQIETEV